MPQWEYDVVVNKETLDDKDEVEFLNKKGMENWEAIRIVRYAQTYIKYYFKRPLIISPGGTNLSSRGKHGPNAVELRE